MTDIFDEKEDIKNLKSFVAFMRDEYVKEMHEKHKVSVMDGGVQERTYTDPDELRRRNRLVTHWPGDDVVGQIVKDTCRLLINNNLEPGDLL